MRSLLEDSCQGHFFLKKRHKKTAPLLPLAIVICVCDTQFCENHLVPDWGESQHQRGGHSQEIYHKAEPGARSICGVLVSSHKSPFYFTQLIWHFLLFNGKIILKVKSRLKGGKTLAAENLRCFPGKRGREMIWMLRGMKDLVKAFFKYGRHCSQYVNRWE